MNEDIYSHPLIVPLKKAGPTVPVDAIRDLADQIKKNKALARKCNQLFRFEASFNTMPGTYLTIWLAFSLALAEDEDSIHTFIDLFELVDPIEHDMLWELAQFSLWQYGDKAVRALMDDFWRIVEIDHTGYYLGVLLGNVEGVDKYFTLIIIAAFFIPGIPTLIHLWRDNKDKILGWVKTKLGRTPSGEGD